MREMIKPQLALGVVDIAAIQLDHLSRWHTALAERSAIHFYMPPQIREEVFTILREVVPQDAEGQSVSVHAGRPGVA